ncbi:MAG: DUF839 domain-containing protein [Candidatus Competibacteraceae bacterium]|nr:DUF839 domain-containing protein [Candidatus Competibacteraceae bacterium]
MPIGEQKILTRRSHSSQPSILVEILPVSELSRRGFIRAMGLGAAGLAVAPLAQFYARTSLGAPAFGPGYGPLTPMLPENTALLPNALSGTPLLSLPKGFRYWAHSITGQMMDDGFPVPADHDGMAAFRGPRNTTILVRNHELSPNQTPPVVVPDHLKFDSAAVGGTTTLVVDSQGRLLRHFASLGGTIRNCAGGPTPWETWITCEENVSVPESGNKLTQKHGYNFEVPANATGPVEAVPLVGMGRFNHEATATDPLTGFVYQTEDRGDSCFYRYRPNQYGNLAGGGVLEALAVKGKPTLFTGPNMPPGEPMPVDWVRIEEVDPDEDTLRSEAQAKGAAVFVRGEGAWYGNGLIYFVSTSGGNAGEGQIWAYDPQSDTLKLVVESPGSTVLDNPDNITVAPDGRLVLCEDGGGTDRLVGVNSAGELYDIARNEFDSSEFAGACFSHDGRFLFVNSQSKGITFVIEGPWRKGRP